MKRAIIAATIYFLMTFALGFALGTVRVIVVAPRIGPFRATLAEVPIMLAAAFFACQSAVHHWQVSQTAGVRWAMAAWFLILLFAVETLLGMALFDRTAADQLAALLTRAGMLGVFAQLVAALFPIFIGRRNEACR